MLSSHFIAATTSVYPSETPVSGSKIIIITACANAVTVFVVVIYVLVVLLIKILSRKQASRGKESDNSIQNNFNSANLYSG